MEKKNYSGIFLLVLVLCVLVLILWKIGTLNFVSGIISKIFSGPRGFSISQLSSDKNFDLIKLSKDLDLIKLQKDNVALRDQFAISNPASSSLLPAKVIGIPTFIPGQTLPDYLILDRGEKDGVKRGQGVVVSNNLVGQISETNSFSSKVILATSKSVSFTGKLESEAVGVVKGVGNGIEIGNILLSENLNKNMVILTKGSQDISGIGIPPNLIVGKIISIDRDPSALFQRAKIQSLLDFTKLNMVFIVVK